MFRRCRRQSNPNSNLLFHCPKQINLQNFINRTLTNGIEFGGGKQLRRFRARLFSLFVCDDATASTTFVVIISFDVELAIDSTTID